MKRQTLSRVALTTAIVAVLAGHVAWADETAAADPAQTAPGAEAPAKKSDESSKDAQSLEGVVVTGSAATGGVKKIDASYTITSANLEQIKQANPKSTADLLKIAPGLWPESTGGQTGANIEIAGFPGGGDAPYFSTLLMGSPIYGMPTLSFFETTSAIRLDDTIERVEILQGGPSVVFADGQIGATANFLLRQGTDTPSGDIGVTYGSEGLWRLDGFYGFKLADDWYGSVGGFYRKSDGVRDPGFPADDGGQFTATVTHDFENGSFMLYGRYLDDKNQFITPIPLLQKGSDSFSSYPGFDPLESTYNGRDIQHVFLAGYPGGGTNADLANGRGSKMHFLGGNFDYDFGGGWTISDKFLYSGGDMDTNALFSGTNPKPLSYYLYGCNGTQNPNFCSPTGAPLDSDNLGLAAGTPVDAHYKDGTPVDPNQSVIHQGWWYIHKHLKNLNNDFRLSKEIFDGNTLTAGLYLAHFTDDDKWALGNQMLMTNTPNAKPIIVNYTQNGNVYQLTDGQGFLDNGGYNITENGTSTNKAFYLSDSWRVDQWLFDASARLENEDATNRVCNLTNRNLDGNDLTLYDNSVPVCNGTFSVTDYDKTHTSWTVGANYEIASNMSVYARVNKGGHFGDFDNSLRGNTTGNTPPLQKIRNYEIGFKYQGDWLYTDISAYHKQFSGLTYQPSDSAGVPNGSQAIYGADSKGINVTAIVTPIERLKIQFTGNYLDGHYSHYDACIPYTDILGNSQCAYINGVQLQRQPKFRFFIQPGYTIPMGWGDLTGFLTYSHVGAHTQDISGLQQLGTYDTLDFGVIADIGANWELRLQGTNITNELGLTESNSRIFGSALGTGGVILARPLEGREVNFQVKYKF
jgi:hypothetical protein